MHEYIYGIMYVAAAAKSLQSCPTLCDTIDGSPPGSPIPGILQARTLDWVAISFSNAMSFKSNKHLTIFNSLFEVYYNCNSAFVFLFLLHYTKI